MSEPRADVVRRGLGVLLTGVREQPRIFAFAVTGSAIYALMTIGSAYVLGRVTERVIIPAFAEGRVPAGALALAAAAILGVSVVKAVGIVMRRLGAGIMQYRLQATYRRRVTRQYLRLPLSWHQRHPTGELLSNANSDVEKTWFPIAPFPFAVGVLLMLLLSGVALLLTDPVLALIGFAVFPAIGVLNFFYNRRISPIATKSQQLRAEVSAIAHESFDGALVVKTLGREQAETDRFRERTELLRDRLIALGRVRGQFDPVMEALPNLGVLLVLLVGSMRVDSGAIVTGDLVSVAYLFTLLSFPVRAIGWVLAELPTAVVGWDRVQGVLRAEGALHHGGAALDPSATPARLGVEQVAFAYAGRDNEDGPLVLHEVSFEVEPGSTIALVGPTGAGKSTIASLLVRLVDPDDGRVTVDGTDVRALQAGSISANAALVPQATFLFDDTVRGNVALGLDVGDDEVWQALQLAQAEGFVRALPDGLDTVVGERGTSLSGGQRQRVALARALVRRPRLLVLDDATSSVDPSVEAAILAGLRDADLLSTVVVVAYRNATIALADEVVYVERGVVRARGTHDELLAAEAGYARMVNAYQQAEADRQGALAHARASARADLDDHDHDERDHDERDHDERDQRDHDRGLVERDAEPAA